MRFDRWRRGRAMEAREAMEAYLRGITQVVGSLLEAQGQACAAAVQLLAGCIERDGLIHLFGTGHSHLLAEEGLYRAGGLGNVNAWLEPSLLLDSSARTSTALERLPGIGAVLVEKYSPQPPDVLIIFSNSGVNAVPVELAMAARERQVPLIGFTSLAYSRSIAPRHASGKRLLDLVDVVIDNQLPPGDALVELPGLAGRIGPGSTAVQAALLNALLVGAAAEAQRRGAQPAVYISANMPGAAEHNAAIVRRFAPRIRHL